MDRTNLRVRESLKQIAIVYTRVSTKMCLGDKVILALLHSGKVEIVIKK